VGLATTLQNIGKNANKIEEYIRIKYMDLFAGEQVKKQRGSRFNCSE